MKMVQLRKALSSFERLLDETGADAELRTQLTRLVMWLAKFDKLDVEELCGSAGVPNIVARSTRTTSAQPDDTLIEEFSARLARVESSRSELEIVLSDMKSDKRVRVAEASEIARRYVGGTSKYKNKADALKEIKLRFEASLRAAQRIGAASEIY